MFFESSYIKYNNLFSTGFITSPRYPMLYYSGARSVYDIQIADTVNYNAIHLLFGLSYTERNSDFIRVR